MKKTWITVLVIAAGLALAAGVMAQGGPGWGKRGFGPGNCWMGVGYGPVGGNSDLTADQLSKFNELDQAYLKDTASLRNEILQKRFELRSLLSQAEPDQKAVMAKQKEMDGLISKLNEKDISHQLETGKILNPEQRSQYPYGYGYAPGGGYGYCTGPGYGRGMRGGYGCGGGPCRW